jgi:Lar family restriction alleviation protein
MDAFAEDAAEITRLRAEITRLTDLCAAYKGQVEAGAAEIGRLTADLSSMSFAHTLAEEQRDTATRALSDLRSRIENPDEAMVEAIAREMCRRRMTSIDEGDTRPNWHYAAESLQGAIAHNWGGEITTVRTVLFALAKDLTPPSEKAQEIDLTKSAPGALPCPFCGSRDVVNWLSHDAAPNVWTVFCQACETEGPHSSSEADSLDKWNRRAALALDPLPTGDTNV